MLYFGLTEETSRDGQFIKKETRVPPVPTIVRTDSAVSNSVG